MASMIDRVMAKSRDERYEDYELDELLCECCITYEDMGQLFTELLSYYAGRFDGDAMELIEKMMGEYIVDTM